MWPHGSRSDTIPALNVDTALSDYADLSDLATLCQAHNGQLRDPALAHPLLDHRQQHVWARTCNRNELPCNSLELFGHRLGSPYQLMSRSCAAEAMLAVELHRQARKNCTDVARVLFLWAALVPPRERRSSLLQSVRPHFLPNLLVRMKSAHIDSHRLSSFSFVLIAKSHHDGFWSR